MNDAERNNSSFRILSGSALKTIALLTMLLDHTTAIVLSNIPFFTEPLSGIPGNITLYSIFRLIGRAAFPIYGFLLTEGYLHTRNKEKYGLRLLIFAVISEICWDLERSGRLFNSGQNVFFTLVFGYIGLCAIDSLKKHPFLACCVLITIGVGTLFAKADYGIFGYAFILLMYGLRQQELLRPFTALLLNNHWFCMAAFVPMFMYNGKRGFIKGPVLKYAFYLFYPVHLFILFLIKYDYIRI